MSVRERVLKQVEKSIVVDDKNQVQISVGAQKFAVNEPCDGAQHATWLKNNLANALTSLVLKTHVR